MNAEATATEVTEEEIIEMTHATMLGEMMNFCITEMKAMPDVWQKMSESKQREVIDRAEDRMKGVIRAAVGLITSEGRPKLVAKVDKVEFKDGVKAQLTMSKNDPARHDLADAQGEEVMIVVSGAEQFTEGRDNKPQPDPDQPDLPLDDDAPEIGDLH